MAALTFDRTLAVLAGTPSVLRAVVASLPPDVQRPSAEAWSPSEVLAHLLHSEATVIGPRVRQAAAENHLHFEAAPPTPPPGEVAQMLEDWSSARAANLEWLPHLTPEQRQHVVH